MINFKPIEMPFKCNRLTYLNKHNKLDNINDNVILLLLLF